jgi:hypothetical protein
VASSQDERVASIKNNEKIKNKDNKNKRESIQRDHAACTEKKLKKN